MNRRNFVVGLGALAAGGGAMVGSGAFSSAEAERTVTVETTDDDAAYLQLEPTNFLGRSSLVAKTLDGPELLALRIPGANEELADGPVPDGVGLDSTYLFGKLVDIRNAGTQPISVTTEFNDAQGGVVNIDFYRSSGGSHGKLAEDPLSLQVGGQERLGLYIETDDTILGEFNMTLTIEAKSQ